MSKSPSSWQLWLMAARPRTLGAAIAPVMVGSAMAFETGARAWLAMLACLIGAVLIQIGTNFANDYFDFIKGADTHERVGPTRVTQAGLIPPAKVKSAFLLSFGLVAIPGLYLSWVGGWPVFLFGALSVGSGLLYTAGPFALAYLGLGDIFVLIFFGGVATCGTYYVQTLSLSPEIFWASLGPGLLSTAILVVNNLRDRRTDALSNKKTLAVRFGARFVRAEYLICVIGASLIPLCIYLFTGAQHLFSLSACLVLLLAVPAIRKVLSMESDPRLNPVLGETGKLLLIYSLLFSLGWLLS